MAQRLAGEGYTVLLPNIFYRVGRPPLMEFPLNFGEKRTMQRIQELSGSLTPEAAERDASAYVEYLSVQGSVVQAQLAQRVTVSRVHWRCGLQRPGPTASLPWLRFTAKDYSQTLRPARTAAGAGLDASLLWKSDSSA
jgi:hypothetical protein